MTIREVVALARTLPLEDAPAGWHWTMPHWEVTAPGPEWVAVGGDAIRVQRLLVDTRRRLLIGAYISLADLGGTDREEIAREEQCMAIGAAESYGYG